MRTLENIMKMRKAEIAEQLYFMLRLGREINNICNSDDISNTAKVQEIGALVRVFS